MFEKQGLYDPAFEHDACGVGFVANLKGAPSHRMIELGLRILSNLEHRGATGCDALTGDGAGILMQIPDEFLRQACDRIGIGLPEPGHYAVGLVFLPRKIEEANFCEQTIERIVMREGQRFLGWRDVPTDNTHIGQTARDGEPHIRQAFIRRGANVADTAEFERRLFLIRKQVEHAVLRSSIAQKPFFHITSLSSVTLLYKGMLLADQLPRYYPDLVDPRLASALALVHQRYSTNTSPTWNLAQPFRYLAHNGEINTLRGNINAMHAREALFETPLFDRPERLCPIILPHQSDSACLDNALELLYQTGRSLPHAMAMLIPEAWEGHRQMSDAKKAFYQYQSALMEPWDGPASIAFTNGRQIGALLDRNGLRPSRYCVTRDGLVIMASETGVLDIPQDQIERKGRLQPGRMFLCDIEEGRIISDEEIKDILAARRPYREWLAHSLIAIEDLPKPRNFRGFAPETLTTRQQCFGYTLEDLKILMTPMALDGKEPVGSMGNDTALAVLSDRPQLLFNYFKQLFAQVTNPPLDAIREELVTSLRTNLGSEGNLLDETRDQCHMIQLQQPILTNQELEKIKKVKAGKIRSITVPMFFNRQDGAVGLRLAMEELCDQVSRAVKFGMNIVVLSDRDSDYDHVPIPSLLAIAGVHHHLIREGTRARVSLVLEAGEPREVMHYALLFGYGCGAINPYVAFDTIEQMRRDGLLGALTKEKAIHNYIHAVDQGVLKVMSKMGISTLQSYRGAQIFEAVGLNSDVVDRYFTGTPSRIEGIGLEEIAAETIRRHVAAYADREIPLNLPLDPGGNYQWRREGERHMYK
ncbi:MAG: glutamate synthase subunit alpha, partial [bacterium]|nr:glutamate synthase subunit alpha [bacterium]